ATGSKIAVDGSGNVYVTGTFTGTVDFDPSPGGTTNLTSAGSGVKTDAFVVKLNATTGALVWAKQIGGASAGFVVSGNAVDGTGNVYVTGQFNGTADFDPSPGGTTNLTAIGTNDIFVVKLDTNGAFGWAARFGSSGINAGHGIALDESGNVYVTG